MNLGVRPRPIPPPNLENPEVYLDLLIRMLDSAAFPHLSRRPQATAAGLVGRKGAWGRIREQMREGARNPAWFRRDLI